MALRFDRPFVAALAGLGILVGGWSEVSHAQATAPVVKADKAAAAADDPLLDEVRTAIEVSSHRYLDAGTHTPWQIVHGVLAYRKSFLIKDNGEKVNAIDWLSNGATYQGTPWFEVTRWGGRAQPFTKPYLFEGHPNQFLGYLSMSQLPIDYEIQTSTGTITLGDIVRNGQMEVQAGEEPTWTLWGLVHYLGPDATWQNKHGESWSIERLVRSQVYEPVARAACGGTHGLFALAYARNKYLETGRPLSGAWLEADQKIQQHIEMARSLQNADGSFSTNFFQGPGTSPDAPTRLGPSGHTLEFLMIALPKERLNETWVRNGIASVARDLTNSRKAPIDCGPLYHAVSGLAIYRDRMQEPATKPKGDLADSSGAADSEITLPVPAASKESEEAAGN